MGALEAAPQEAAGHPGAPRLLLEHVDGVLVFHLQLQAQKAYQCLLILGGGPTPTHLSREPAPKWAHEAKGSAMGFQLAHFFPKFS